VVFDENPKQFDWIPGSTRVNGQAVEAGSGEALAFTGLTVAAQGSVTLSYVARPRIASTPSASGQALLRGIDISGTSAFSGPAVGCGCGHGGDPSAWAWALAAALSAARGLRRRKQGQRKERARRTRP
jgi:MYXO-CTERM domain-containing protein